MEQKWAVFRNFQKIFRNFTAEFLKLTNLNRMMENKDDEKKIDFQRKTKRKPWRGFPIWVWLLLLAVVVGIYIGLSLKYK